VIDIMSNGRFDFGIGVGSQFEEFRTFGINPDERVGRTWEMAELIERCFGAGTFSFGAARHDFPEITSRPPVQKQMPIWWGGRGRKPAARGGAAIT
jgi:alkanesulfonate monooxygenase SsuD/methylene tetrahydromethanopterin reductase-like flavin-dependent oxidoreductase (luciferase family)